MILRLLLLPLCLFGLPLAASLEKTRPNIILVMTDDQGYAQQACHGHPWLKTPNIDRLHGQATRFTTFMVAPTCSPTRAAIMSGRHPEKNGITHTILERDRMALDAVTLPQVLKKVGYVSGIFGKWHLGDEDAYQPGVRGFDEVFVHGAGGIGQAYKCSNADAPGNKYFDPVIRHNGRFVKTRGFCTDVFFRAALGWIRKQGEAGQPFFCYLATNAPHGPFIAPPENRKRFTDLGFTETNAGYYGMIENIDANMGLLMAKLDEWKLSDNTVLIFMSDNGTTGGGSDRKGSAELAKGYPFYNGGMKGLKNSNDEGGSRVPFFVRWPGRIEAGRDVDTLAAHIDILPTLAALAGAPIPEKQVEGRSLLPLLQTDASVDWADRCIFNHICRWKTGANPDDFKDVHFSARNQRYRLVGPKRAGQPELYDMVEDPGQKTNVAEKHPEVVKAMLDAYHQYWKEARPLMVNEDAPMSPVRPYHVAYAAQLENGGIPEWQEPAL